MRLRPALLSPLLIAAAVALPVAARSALPPLVPRAVLFGEAEQDDPAISPDGRWLVWSRRGADGVANLWVRSLERDTSWQVTHARVRGVHGAAWTSDSKRLLILDDQGGDEIEHLFAVEPATGATRDLTPFPGVRAEGIHTDPRGGGAILVGLNRRDPGVFDLWRIDLAGGEPTLAARNPGDVVDWTTDGAFRVRACTALRPADATTLLRVRDPGDTAWREIAAWPMEEAGPDRARKIVGFVGDDTLLVRTWAGGATSRLVWMSARDGRVLATLAQDPRCDLWDLPEGDLEVPQVLRSPDGRRVLAVGFEYLAPEWRVLDAAVRPDLDALARLARGATVTIVSQDAAGRRWVVGLFDDRSPGRYVLWDRVRRRATPLFAVAPSLARWTFAAMRPVTLPAGDGLTLPAYLTLPPGVPARGLPLVVNPHGGPWYRDAWGWNPEVQWLANRGYAVLQVEFRGSTGFGTPFLNAADHEFGPGRVGQDLVDAVRWAVARGIADPARVGILGWSFGGYSTLAGLAFHPEVYACGVDGVGPSDVRALIESFPPWWAPRRQRWLNRWGDVVADSALNARVSPLHHVDAMRAPLLIGHGLNDPRVRIAASEAIVRALRERGREVGFVVYPDEGHGFGRAENNQDFYGRAEEFLARHLGGRAEPWRAVPGSTAQVR